MMRKGLLALLTVIILGGIVVIVEHHMRVNPKVPVVQPVITTQPASQPTTRKVKPKYPTYMELIRAENPMVAATQPLDYPLDLPDAAHLIIHDPTYLDLNNNLWITRKDGQPSEKALVKPADVEEHIITDRPLFVHWWVDESGKWAAALVVKGDKAGYDLITKTGKKHLADDRRFKWNTAFSILGRIVVTTDCGVSVFDIDPEIKEHYHALPGCDDQATSPGNSATNPPVTLLDTRGILAWAPWEKGKPGSSRISRFIISDDSWTDLPAVDWPARPIQLSMLLDGSVLRMAAGIPTTSVPVEGVDETRPGDQFADQIHLSIGQLDPTNFDLQKINDMVAQLSHPDPDVRQDAFDQLSRYGPAIAPVLEKLADQQLPAARTRIQQLLKNKITPALAGLTVIDNRLDVVRRCADGTVIFFAPAGVQIPTEKEDPQELVPAWLALRSDGRMERPLIPALVADQKPQACTLYSYRDDWVVNDDAGPRRLLGSAFEPLLSPAEKRFSQIVGIGTRHRWVFREPGEKGDTLVVDPGVADPTPKLPGWVIVTPNATAGWDSKDFPALSKGDEGGGDWELNADGWRSLEESEKVITEKPPATQPTSEPATQPSTHPTTLASTNSTTGATTRFSFGVPILTTPDGTQYYNGKDALMMVKKNADPVKWALPGPAVGTADPVLMQTTDGLLFLFNQSGRLLRIRPTPGASEPFKLEATFTDNIPNTDTPTRVWLDPAGRIDFITDASTITVTFPAGHIPKEISRMMLDEKH
jgi:hypothetical protein